MKFWYKSLLLIPQKFIELHFNINLNIPRKRVYWDPI